MVKLVEALLHPYRVPGIGKVLSKIDPLSAKLDKTVSNSLDYDTRPNKDDPSAFKCGGKVKKVKKFAKGGSMDDLAPRGNLPDKNAVDQKWEQRKKAAPEKLKQGRRSPRMGQVRDLNVVSGGLDGKDPVSWHETVFEPSPRARKNGAQDRIAKMAKGGTVRGDGCCVKGKSKGRFR